MVPSEPGWYKVTRGGGYPICCEVVQEEGCLRVRQAGGSAWYPPERFHLRGEEYSWTRVESSELLRWLEKIPRPSFAFGSAGEESHAYA